MSKKTTPHIILDDFWPYQTVVLADQISRYTLSIVRAEANLNLSQWRVLAAVAEEPGRTAAQVTAITPMDKTIVSRAVNSLIALGLIKKISDISDKRRSSLSTTAAGQDVYVKVARHLNTALIDGFNGTLPPKDFTKILKRFSDKMSALSPPKN